MSVYNLQLPLQVRGFLQLAQQPIQHEELPGGEGHQQVTIEGIAAINPDVIVVPQPIEGANAFIDELKSSAALLEVPALTNDRIYYVLPKYHTTLSHWNVRGVEQMAALLFPSDFQDVDMNDFSLYAH